MLALLQHREACYLLFLFFRHCVVGLVLSQAFLLSRCLLYIEVMANARVQDLLLLGAITLYLIITLLVLSYVTVALRLWVRYRITKSPGWDDAAMVATLLLFTSYCTFILVITFRTMDGKFFSENAIHTTLIVSTDSLNMALP
jgi:hypothetical protein